MHSPKAVRRPNSGSVCSGLWSPLAAANSSMSRRPKRISRSSAAPGSPGAAGPVAALGRADTVEHQLPERGDGLLLEQGVVGQPHVEPRLELVHDADLGQRVPALDRTRPIVVADLDAPAENLLEGLAEALLELVACAHGWSAM